MFGLFKPKNPEEHRYYLLPGMGKANRRKRAMFLRWAIAVGIFVSLLISTILYLMHTSGPLFLRW